MFVPKKELEKRGLWFFESLQSLLRFCYKICKKRKKTFDLKKKLERIKISWGKQFMATQKKT